MKYGQCPGHEADEDPHSRESICGRAFERMTQCLMAALDKNTTAFAAYVPFFLSLYTNNALLSLDAGQVHRMRYKRRVLVTRFLARVLLCPVYDSKRLSEDQHQGWLSMFLDDSCNEGSLGMIS